MSDTYNRIAVVTGVTSGIGEATMRTFVHAGFGVVGNGRNASKLAALEKEIGPGFCYVAGDAADTGVVNRLFDMAVDRFGREADIVVANAGRGLPGSVKNVDIAQFDDVLRINVGGALACIQKAAKTMVETQKNAYPGSAADIIIIGSVVGRHISPFSAVYGASKFAVHALAEGLRREVGPKGVRVSLVEPGIVMSGFQNAAGYSDELVNSFHEKFGRLLIGDDIAQAVLYIVTRPPHVHISDIVVRPTGMDYP
ncbi:MAG: SDR family oxidoreductase [Chitinispirillaceae bacterium]|nr:SDR family oxidoreductase [Chitinispirillaceae bacterium]